MHVADVNVLTNRKVSDRTISLQLGHSLAILQKVAESEMCVFVCVRVVALDTVKSRLDQHLFLEFSAHLYWVNGVRSGISSVSASG